MARNKKTTAPFDRLRRDPNLDGYTKNITHRGHRVQVQLLAESREQLDRMIPTAVKFWRGRDRWFKAFREYAVDSLLDRLNRFLDCGEDKPTVITPARLKSILAAPFLVVFTFDYDDPTIVYFEMNGGESDALQSHCIEVSGTLEEGITDGDVVSLI